MIPSAKLEFSEINIYLDLESQLNYVRLGRCSCLEVWVLHRDCGIMGHKSKGVLHISDILILRFRCRLYQVTSNGYPGGNHGLKRVFCFAKDTICRTGFLV